MILTHIFIGGFLFATACATATPNIATLEVLPNFDQGLTRKDFRVIYPGIQKGGSDVKIKIYKEGVTTEVFHTFKVPDGDVKNQKEYYFGLSSATSGKYDVVVCNSDSSCSDRTSSLSSIPHKKGEVKCPKGRVEESTGEWVEVPGNEVVLDITQPGDWLTEKDIEKIEEAMNGGTASDSKHYTEWRKYGIDSNPSYRNEVLYAGVNYDMLLYKPMFMTKKIATETSQTNPDDLYVNEFCERKYFLSAHIHLVDTSSKEVKYRFKKTLYMSPGGKNYFIIKNDENLKRQVHVEMAFKDTKIAAGAYTIWVSLCTTEKDVNDSTMCSDPVVHETELTVNK